MMPMALADLMNRMRGRLTCAKTLELLQQYLDGEINADDARAVAKHLESCSLCDEESEVYRRVKAAIEVAAVAPDPDIVARLEAFGERVRNGEMVD